MRETERETGVGRGLYYKELVHDSNWVVKEMKM